MKVEGQRAHDKVPPKQRSFKSILKILDNNYTHSISKAAIHLHFKEIVSVQCYDKETWNQWEDGLMVIGQAVGMNEHALERLRLKELRKAKYHAKRPNYNGKFGFAEVIRSREDAEKIIDGINGNKNDLVSMLIVHTEAMHALKVANMRMHLALGIEEHKALLAREYAEECEVMRCELVNENKKLRTLLAAHHGLNVKEINEELDEFLGKTNNTSSDRSLSENDDDGFGDDGEILGAEHCPIFNSDTRVAGVRVAQQQMRAAMMSKMTSLKPQVSPANPIATQSSIPPNKGPRLVAKLSEAFFSGNKKPVPTRCRKVNVSSGDLSGCRDIKMLSSCDHIAANRMREAIEVSRDASNVGRMDSSPISERKVEKQDDEISLFDAPRTAIASATVQRHATPLNKKNDAPIVAFESPTRTLLLSPRAMNGNLERVQKAKIDLEDGLLSPLRLLELKEAIRVDEKARLELDEEEDEIKNAQLDPFSLPHITPIPTTSNAGSSPIIESEETVPMFGWFCKLSSFFLPARQHQQQNI